MKVFICLCLYYLLIFQKFSFAEEFIKNNQKKNDILNQTIGYWLDILSAQNSSIDSRIFTKDVEFSFLMTTEQKDKSIMLKQRQKAFEGGKYAINKIIIIDDKPSFLKIKLVLDWEKITSSNKIEKARIEQFIELVYPKGNKRLFIKSIDEKFTLPSDGLATKLKC